MHQALPLLLSSPGVMIEKISQEEDRDFVTYLNFRCFGHLVVKDD